MIKSKLFFEIELKYQTKNFEPLKELGNNMGYEPKTKNFVWMFPISNLRNVLAILGKPLTFDYFDFNIVKQYSEERKQTITKGPSQGEGFINVQLHSTKPNYFQVTTVRERQPQNTNVSFETVQALWKVIKLQALNNKILTGIVADRFCHELGIIDFDTYKNDKFNWKYFSGSRKHYLIFYAAIKVLQYYGVIEHVIEASKSGIIKKKKRGVYKRS